MFEGERGEENMVPSSIPQPELATHPGTWFVGLPPGSTYNSSGEAFVHSSWTAYKKNDKLGVPAHSVGAVHSLRNPGSGLMCLESCRWTDMYVTRDFVRWIPLSSFSFGVSPVDWSYYSYGEWVKDCFWILAMSVFCSRILTSRV